MTKSDSLLSFKDTDLDKELESTVRDLVTFRDLEVISVSTRSIVSFKRRA
jgi:hypothetical protein